MVGGASSTLLLPEPGSSYEPPTEPTKAESVYHHQQLRITYVTEVLNYVKRDVLSDKLSTSSALMSADVATAFLPVREQTLELYMRLPAEALRLLGAAPDNRMSLLKPCSLADNLLKKIGPAPHPFGPC
eukprot:10261251-Heterocapsa_arctica.AAC.1